MDNDLAKALEKRQEYFRHGRIGLGTLYFPTITG
ncbi:Uncharacterised protein [Mycobacterium tuberculosis]|uniref:Uncharacterized protein n=1 Tax=Mycobacterium tuberculosis TaxID=1773 RepID=A0A916P766_MYCTX|nr:Uncharacterised protein [Mycobacterium tuberculosis]COW70110.1 Uncharacterised protein [Mycobacterium tuberculosis]COX22812.1 Uncharacterised protein [Mycobacterium tuberculosis]